MNIHSHTYTHSAHSLILSIKSSIKNTLEGNLRQIIETHYYFAHSVIVPDAGPMYSEPHSTTAASLGIKITLLWLFTALGAVFQPRPFSQ